MSAVLALGQAFGLGVVAEGIEREEQCRLLVDMGCVYGQGYFFSRPRSAADIEALEVLGGDAVLAPAR